MASCWDPVDLTAIFPVRSQIDVLTINTLYLLYYAVIEHVQRQ
jgi:hypothetical protein